MSALSYQEPWLPLPGDRLASPLGKPMRKPARGHALPASYQLGDRGFLVLGPLPEGRSIRPTVAYGYVRGALVEVVHGHLSVGELESLRAFWRLS